MNNLDKQYLELLEDIIHNGVIKETRNGPVRSVFGRVVRHDMREGFPLLTTKKMWFKGIRTELEWFLNGSTNIQPLVKKGNNIWVGDAYKRYLEKYDTEFDPNGSFMHQKPTEDEFIELIKTDDEFAKKWGYMGPIYGKQWRKWKKPNHVVDGRDVYTKKGRSTIEEYKNSNEFHVDQIQTLINMLQSNPDSRRMMVNAWNVGELDKMVLPPCHYGFQVWSRKLSLRERVDAIPRVLSKEKVNKYTKGGYLYVNHVLNNETIPKRGISLMWNQRSVDTPLGLPFNIASYGLLLEMLADEVMMLPLELIGNLGDTHIYENQIEGVEEQLSREDKIHELPKVQIMDGIYSRGEQDIQLIDYESEPKIYFPLSN